MNEPMTCPECSDDWIRGRKSCKCGYKLVAAKAASVTGDTPEFCTWANCPEKAVIVLAEVSRNGRTYRKAASDVMSKAGQLAGGWAWGGWVARCNLHWHQEQDAAHADWREEILQQFWRDHPEFAVVPRDEQERKDVLSMAKAFAMRNQREIERRAVEHVAARKRASQEQYERERDALDELGVSDPFFASPTGTMPADAQGAV